MLIFRRVAPLFALAFALSGCGADKPADAPSPTETAPPTKAAVVGTAGQDSPEKLFAEYVQRLSKVDGPGVCALFTDLGAVAYQDEWEASPCELAVTLAAEKIPNLADFAAKATPKSQIVDSDSVVELSACKVGGMKALKSDTGWLIDAYRNPATVTGC